MADCRSYLRKAWSMICLLTVEPALFLLSMGLSISATASKVLFFNKVCIMLIDDTDVCVSRNFTSEDQEMAVQQEVSNWEFYMTVTGCIPAVAMNVVYANLVDRWSKKYSMLFCPVGYILCTVIHMICAIYLESSPAFMLLGTVVTSISGGMLTMLGACFSYMSATAGESNLIIHISLAEAAMLASSSVSSFVSGILFDTVGYFYVYLISIIVNVLVILYILVRLKNIPPLAPDKDSVVPGNVPILGPTESTNSNVPGLENVDKTPGYQRVDDAEINFYENEVIEDDDAYHDANAYAHATETDTVPDADAGSTHPICDQEVLSSRGVCFPLRRSVETVGMFVKAYVNTVVRRRELNKRSAIIGVLSIICFNMICVSAVGGLCYLFVSQEPLSWSTTTYGYYTGASHVIKGLCLLVILPAFRKLNVPYPIIMIISLISSIIGHTIFALSLYTWMAFLAAVIAICETALIVTARSFIVSFIEKDEHGKAFGIIASVESLSALLSSAIFNLGIYPATVAIFSGLAILIAAMLLVLPLAVAIWLHVFIRRMARRVGLHLQIQSENGECEA